MKIRDHVIDDRHALAGNARTWTFNINLVDPVTEFKIHFRARNDTTGVAADYLCPCPLPYLIEEIAVIDGSEVIFALNGPQCIAMSCFDLGYAPLHWHQELPGMHQYWNFPIHFGRSLVDPEWIFDPTKFRNPQLRITWDLAAIRAVGAGGYLANSVVITVWAKIMEEGARPRGYLMTKEIKEYTPTGLGDEITYLPTDFPHRKLMVRNYAFNNEMMEAIEHIKLSQDQDKWIPVDMRGEDFIWLMKNWFTEVQFHGKYKMGNTDIREHFMGNFSHGVAVAGGPDCIVGVHNWVGNCFECEMVDGAGTAYGLDNQQIVWATGMTRTPFDCFCYPFGNQDNPADWLQVVGMGNLRLILTHGLDAVAGVYAETQVVCQQAHPY